MTRLCTNLPRTPSSVDLVSRLYRFRWQIELCFTEWKSYANLHEFDTGNAHVAEGLMWAGLGLGPCFLACGTTLTGQICEILCGG